MNYGYKELEIPSGPNNTHLLDKNGLHIWPRTHEGIPFVMIALPNTDGSFTVTLFSPHEGNAGFSSLLEDDKINEFFDLHFKDIKDLMLCLNFFISLIYFFFVFSSISEIFWIFKFVI